MNRFFAVGIGPIHPEAQAEVYEHEHQVSLDDADVVVFGLPPAPYSDSTYLGKPSLSDHNSFQYKDIIAHWHRELLSALSAGKTVFVVLTTPEVVYVATGEIKRSGTGRNAAKTRLVAEQSNLDALPYKLQSVATGFGNEIEPVARSRVLQQYWKELGPLSWYEVRFAPREGQKPLLTTKNSNQIVSAVVSFKSGGHLVLLPAVRLWGNDDYDEDDGDEDEDGAQGDDNPDDPSFRLNSINFVQRLLKVDAELRGGAPSPPPDWAQDPQYETAVQSKLRKDLLKAQETEVQARKQCEALALSLEDAGVLQHLLFGQGRPLEDAVIRGLELMGIGAAKFEGNGSEFDAVFTIDEQRMLGETEGRDNGPITIDKITQLERNVGEDYARDDVTERAHGVLFGNPQRLIPPNERKLTFTEKCLSSAERNDFALVLTHKMFEPAAYLEESGDLDYAAACRAAITAAKGELVEFPKVPDTPRKAETETTGLDDQRGTRP